MGDEDINDLEFPHPPRGVYPGRISDGFPHQGLAQRRGYGYLVPAEYKLCFNSVKEDDLNVFLNKYKVLNVKAKDGALDVKVPEDPAMIHFIENEIEQMLLMAEDFDGKYTLPEKNIPIIKDKIISEESSPAELVIPSVSSAGGEIKKEEPVVKKTPGFSQFVSECVSFFNPVAKSGRDAESLSNNPSEDDVIFTEEQEILDGNAKFAPKWSEDTFKPDKVSGGDSFKDDVRGRIC